VEGFGDDKIFKISKKEFNIGSPKQLGEIIYNDLKIAGLKKTRKGSFATSASVLEDLAFKGNQFPQLILDWRQVSKLKNTYSDSLPEHINPKTKRVHTSFLLAATTTGRLASSDPNLQNIPIKSEDGKDIRKAFIAKNGFPVSSRLSEQITNDKLLRKTETSKRFFYDKDNSAKKTEEIIYNKNFSETLEYISVEGVEGFYHGKIAKKIIQKIHKSKINPGEMELSDLKNYKAKKRNVICKQYRIVWKVCGMPPPSSGGIAILQALGILENFDMHNYKGQTDKIIHLLSETLRLIFEDRNKYIGDPDFVKVPMENLLNPFYLKERSQLIKLDQKMEKTFPMSFEDSQDISFSEMASNEKDSTSHISIIDQEGNAVAFTSSIESAFGSRLMVEGFLLNNQLTDFSFIPNKNGIKVANKVEPNKRPMSSMSPTLVFKNNSLFLILGSPGGQNIISYVLKTLIYIIDFDMNIVKAIDAPNFAIRNQEMFIEENRLDDLTIRRLEDLGHDIVYKKMKSGLNVIKIKNGKIYGEADSRRQGLALGN